MIHHDIEKLYYLTRKIRRAEETVEEIYPSDKIKSPIHLAIGHEAVEVGVCNNLRQTDVVFGYYRSHGLYLAKGGDINAMMAELYGKRDGCCKGRGGSMHLVDVDAGVMGTSAIVASTIPNAVGYAYAAKLRGEGQVVVSFFGDGATEEGVFYESLNFAELKKLPILFVCINNGLAIYTHQEKRQAVPDITAKVRGFGLKTSVITNGDIFSISRMSNSIIEDLRQGQGPYFMECHVGRWRDHVGPGEDFGLKYRDVSEVTPWKEIDVIEKLGSMLDSTVRDRINRDIEQEIKSAVDFAENSPFPEKQELYQYVYR